MIRNLVLFTDQTLSVTGMELRKLFRDPTELFSRIIQPILWLVIFGQVFGRVRGIPTGAVSYLAFIAPGVLSQSILFSAIFYGIAVIWEKDLGMVHKLMVSPAFRISIVAGKALTAGVRGLIQTCFIYALVLFLDVPIQWSPLALAGVIFSVMIGSAIFSTFSLIVACIWGSDSF